MDRCHTRCVTPNSIVAPFSGFALRPVVVVSQLDRLRGPLEGRRQVPLHLDSSARPFYDFGSPAGRAQAYQLVLLEATDARDVEAWLQEDALLGLWPELYLPRPVRAAWEAQHPPLAAREASNRVPQL